MAKVDLTAERVRELFDYRPDTGEFFWKQRGSKRATQIVIGSKAGRVRGDGYVQIYIGRSYFRAHRLAWLYVYGEFPLFIDHINRDRADNRIANLRVGTSELNNQNRRANRLKAVASAGVTKGKKGGFCARISATLAGHKCGMHLGTFSSEAEAYAVYSAAKHLLHPNALISEVIG